MKEQQAQALAAMMMDMSDDDDDADLIPSQPDGIKGEHGGCDIKMGRAGAEKAVDGSGMLFAEADEALPTQCVLCHEGGICPGAG